MLANDPNELEILEFIKTYKQKRVFDQLQKNDRVAVSITNRYIALNHTHMLQKRKVQRMKC